MDMSKTINDLPNPRRGRRVGFGGKYPWEKWLDGQTWVLDRSDIDDDVLGMAARTYRAARVRNIKVKVRRDASRGEIYVQAVR